MNAKVQEYKDTLERCLLDKNKPWTKYFDKIETQLGVNRVYVFVGLVAFTGLYLVFGFGAELICNSIGFVYPAYMSMKALESPQKDDDTKWLTYWVVYACFSLVEYFSDFIVGWFPFYWLMKCIFVIWCYLPTDYNGSLIIYHRIIRPFYQKYHSRIDGVASSVLNRRALDISKDVKTVVKDANQNVQQSLDALRDRKKDPGNSNNSNNNSNSNNNNNLNLNKKKEP